MVTVYLILSVVPGTPFVGSILPSPSSFSSESTFVAVMVGTTGWGGGNGGLTSASLTGDLLLPVSFVFERLPSLTVGLPTLRGAAMAAIGVISIVNESKQATNTLRLLGAGSGDNLFTTN